MKTLSKYLKFYKKQCVFSPVFKFAESVMELMVPLVIASLIDKGINANNTSYVWQMGGLLLLFAFLGLLFAVSAQYFAAYAAVGTAKRLRRDLFIHIQGFSYSTLDSIGSSTLITRMTSDIDQVQNGVNLTLRLLLRSPFIVFGALLASFLLDVKAALVFSVSIPLLGLAVFIVSSVTIPIYKKVQGKLDGLLVSFKNALGGVRVVRAFGREKEEAREFEDKNSTLFAEQNKVGKIAAILDPVTYLIVNLAIVLIIKIGANRIYHGDLTQGNLVALYGYMSQILIELIKLANLLINLSKTAASTKRIQAVFDIESEDVAPIPSVETKDDYLRFDDVSMRYFPDSGNAIEHISFSLKKGETLGLIGGTGSGKSTIIDLLPLFYRPDSGSIYLDGINALSMDREELRRRIAVVPQKAVLFKGTIRENLTWGAPNASDDDLWEALTYAQCKDFVESKEGGLDYRISQNGSNLSGGQRQRLTIARALVKRPEILVLDDSSSALDYETDAKLRKALKELPFKPTVVLSSQRTSAVMHSDKIVVLEDGKQVGEGEHKYLLENCEVYQSIYYSQFKKGGAE